MMSPDFAPSVSSPATRSSRARHAAVVACTGVAVVGTLLAQAPERRPARPTAAAAKASSHWEDYGGGPDSSKFVDLTQITPQNVAGLTVAWTYPVGDNNVYQFNPIVVGTTMYVLAKNQSLVALDATTGKELWIHAGLRGMARRGINYWESPDGRDRRLIFQINNNLQAIDAATGKSILTFGKNGIVDLREGIGRDPSLFSRVQSGTPGKIFENLLLLGSSPGEGYVSAPGTLRAFDVVTGKLVWAFHTVPHPGEEGYETWPKDAWKYVGGANTWGEISVDPRRGIAYFPTGSPTYDYYGADRIGSNLYANSLIALDARTGKRRWHYQVVHHDLWDYDLTAAPQLITIRNGGRTIDAVALAAKHGFLFVFDRVTGAPVWPIEERPIEKSTIPGEQTWPTQPFPTRPAPFSRQQMTVDDLTPLFLTDAERASWTERLKKARSGLFAPLSTEHETIAVPGAVGGANWGNTAAYPAKGLVYVISQDFPSFYKLSETPPNFNPPAAGRPAPDQRGRALYAQQCQACHAPDRAGSPTAPTLLGLGSRVRFDDFRQVVLAGRGHMPAFPSTDDAAMRALWGFVTDGAAVGASPNATPPAASSQPGAATPRAGGGTAAALAAAPLVVPEGPVVGVGGAPGGLDVRPGPGFRPGGAPYPDGVDAPKARYYTGYGLGFPYIMKGRWSQITAYDLNTGAIKWQKPLGVDKMAAEAGVTDAGVPRGGQRMGMIVTSNGLLFATAKDGHVRAYDAETGDVLWTGVLPRGTEGLPAMYEANGRQYLVVCATTGLTWGKASREGGPWTQGDGEPNGPSAYVAFALPERPAAGSAAAK
jgi:quinoprotein glucose dehydrogenase